MYVTYIYIQHLLKIFGQLEQCFIVLLPLIILSNNVISLPEKKGNELFVFSLTTFRFCPLCKARLNKW